MFLDVGFEEFEVAIGEGVFWQSGGVVFHRNDVEVIIASLGSAHASVRHEGIDLAGDVFGTDEDGCVVVEERHKVVDTVPLGLLVADEAYGVILAFLAELEDASEGFLHLDIHPSILASQFDEEAVHHLIINVVALLPILGTLTSYLRADYFDGREQSTEFISLLFAPPSSGKSFIDRFGWLLDNIRRRDYVNNKREEIYAVQDSKKSDNERGEDAPKVSVRIVKPLISIPELLTKMRDNHGNHMLIIAEELDTFSKGNKTTGGDKSDLWRVTWDNGFYGQYYKSTKTFKGEVQMFLNLLFTSTQGQIDRFFKNVEDGLVTRFSVCPIENQMYRSFIPWKNIPKKEIYQIKNILTRLDSKVYKVPLNVDGLDLDDIKASEFDEVVPWQFDFLPQEKLDLSYLFPTLLEWLEEERVKSALTLNPARDVFRRRAALKGFRVGLVCHGLYATVGKKEQEVIKNFVRWFCSVDLRNSLYQFGERYNELQNKAVAKRIPQSKVYDKLDGVFEATDVRLALQKAGKKTPVKVVISLWKTNGLIERLDNNKYQKLKKA